MQITTPHEEEVKARIAAAHRILPTRSISYAELESGAWWLAFAETSVVGGIGRGRRPSVCETSDRAIHRSTLWQRSHRPRSVGGGATGHGAARRNS